MIKLYFLKIDFSITGAITSINYFKLAYQRAQQLMIYPSRAYNTFFLNTFGDTTGGSKAQNYRNL